MENSKLLRLIVISGKAWTRHLKCLKITKEIIIRLQKPLTTDGFPSFTTEQI